MNLINLTKAVRIVVIALGLYVVLFARPDSIADTIIVGSIIGIAGAWRGARLLIA